MYKLIFTTTITRQSEIEKPEHVDAIYNQFYRLWNCIFNKEWITDNVPVVGSKLDAVVVGTVG